MIDSRPADTECKIEHAPARPGRISWAQLLKRVFDIEIATLADLLDYLETADNRAVAAFYPQVLAYRERYGQA